MTRIRPVVAAALAAAVLLGTWTVAAGQVPTLPPLGPTTTTAPGQTTTTTEPVQVLPGDGGGDEPSPSPSPDPDPGPQPGPQPPGPTPPAAPAPGGAPPPGPAPLVAPPGAVPEVVGVPPALGVVPPEAQALMDSIIRSGARNTAELVEALRPLEDLGFTPTEAAVMGFGRFPVAGYATWVHDWWFPRFVPAFHLHEGTDVFATAGTPVRAPMPGNLRLVQGAISGLAVYVVAPDATYVFMGHLQAFAPGLADGQAVRQGDVVGFVGDSGNALGGAAHVHLEYHPQGGPAVDPKPLLDQWVDEAVAAAPALIAAQQKTVPRVLLSTGLSHRLEGTSAAGAAPPLLWTSSVSPAGGPLQLVEAEASGVARRLDWAELARREQARAAEVVDARRRAAALLTPLTPAALAAVVQAPSTAD